MTEQLPKQVYTNDYREQAVLLVTRDGLSIAEGARREVLVFEDLGELGQARQRWTASGSAPRCRTPACGHRRTSRGVTAAARSRRVANGARHLEKSHRVLCQRVAARCAVIRELRSDYPLAVLCRVLSVSRSGYHAWLVRQPSKRTYARERLKVAAQGVFPNKRHFCFIESDKVRESIQV